MSTQAVSCASEPRPCVLVVEDDAALNTSLTEMLCRAGYSVSQSFDGEEALNLAVSHDFQLILLDLMLPGRDGLSLLSILRSTKTTPVIILSAKHAEEERIQGLSAGADDYLAKPFNKEELLLRIDALLRRTLRLVSRDDSGKILDGLAIDFKAQKVLVMGQEVTLTPSELSLLWILLQNTGQVLSKAFLYQTVMNRSYSQYDRSVDMHLSRVRRKLAKAGWNGARLQTVHGKGYCLK